VGLAYDSFVSFFLFLCGRTKIGSPSVYQEINNTPGWALRKKSDRVIWNLNPGQVIQYLATKCKKMLDQELTTQWERNAEWYEKTANRPSEWGEIKNNVPKQCKRDKWGGSSEINFWAIITKIIMVEINVDNETALIHHPDSYTTTGLNLRTQMQALKDMQATTHTKKTLSTLYMDKTTIMQYGTIRNLKRKATTK
jgi:hypothetical protein